MGRKKIAFIVAIAGTAHSFLTEHMELLVNDYDVHLIANFSADSEKDEFEKIGVTCHIVGICRKITIANDLKALIQLTRFFKQENFASVHSVTPKAGLLTALAGWFSQTPFRIHIFTGQVWATRRGVMRRLLKCFDKLIARLDTNILVDGEGQRQFLIRERVIKPENSLVLANGSIAGVKLDRFVISESVRLAERKKFNFNNDDVCFIFLGRLNHDKGIGELLNAFNTMLPRCPLAKLVLYGTDEDGYDDKVPEFKNIIKGKNYFYPGITRTPYDALQAGDVFVIPTWREGFGMSVIEAQALGLPVITSDAYGVIDASVNGVTGLRCKVGDSISLIDCMETYYFNPDMRKQHGVAGRKRVEQEFDNKIVSQAWLDYYHELLD